MSLLTSLASATTGLASASADLSVIGDNISNSNTIGFKEGRAAFEDTLAQSVVNGGGQIGLGSRLQAVQKLLNQGALATTGVTTDLALQGNGFFEVAGTASDGRTGAYLTRNGQFTTDRDGYLVNLDGMRVQGYMADAAGVMTTVLGDLMVGNASAQPLPTSELSVQGNIQSDAPILDPVATPWDPTDPSATSNFSSSVTVYDSLGNDYQVQIYYRRTGAGTWDWHAMTDGGSVVGGTAGTPFQIGNGTMTFDTNGVMTGLTQVSNFNPLGATNPQPLTFNLGDPAPPGTGLAGLTQFASPSATTYVGQDGYGSGQLTSIQIDQQGVVVGTFTNGETRPLGQVGVARVAAPDQLERIGGNLFAVTRLSGEAVMGAAGNGGRAFIASGTLEQSNVDIADQFVRMIAAQRAFEANAKTITTSDQLLSELIQMKR